MIVEYVTDTSGWEEWQKDYRLGLILIMPPREVSELVDPLRSRHDPKAFASCPTHISVSDPLRMEMTEELDEEIRETAPSGSFLCDRLEFIVPDINMQFQRVKSYSLGDRQKAF